MSLTPVLMFLSVLLSMTLSGSRALSPQNISFWDTGYFELVILKKQKTQEDTFTLPLPA